MEKSPFPNKIYRDSIAIIPAALRQNIQNEERSIKKINVFEYNKRKSNFKSFNLTSMRNMQNKIDEIKQRESSQSIVIQEIAFNKTKTKGVRFKDRISIDARDSMTSQRRSKDKNKILIDITNQQKIEMLNTIAKNKQFSLPMTSRRRAHQNIKIVSDLLNLPIQSKSTIINQLKCFMCHYPQQNSILFGKRTITSAKQTLIQLSHLDQTKLFFRYDAFGLFLKSLQQLNYDSHQTISSFQTLQNKYTYPTSITIMIYYLGNYLYQFNNMYERAEASLKNLFNQIMKFKLYQYVGVYLVLIIKMKANLLEWEACQKYLMKLLAYAWAYRFQNLQIWAYFELSRCYFFMNQVQESEYFNVRSEMSIAQPLSSIYRQLIAKEFVKEIQYMRAEHKNFDFDKKISICELKKLPTHPADSLKDRDTFKLQSQIKSINEHCKIKHVKNLLSRMNSGSTEQIKTTRNITSDNKTHFGPKSSRHLAGNPLLRTHESGLKNLNVYFRLNPKGQSLLMKNREPKLYTFQNSSKNILVLKQLCRNILLQMKWFIPINMHQNSA